MFGATDIETVNLAVAADAEQRGILVNIVDNPKLCNVIFPAIIDRDPLLISVSSSGAAPVLARAIRSQLESTVPANTGELADYIAARRSRVRQVFNNNEQLVRVFWEQLLESEIAERVFAGRVRVGGVLCGQQL